MFVSWQGAVLQHSYTQLYRQIKKVPIGVFVASVNGGSPASLYGLSEGVFVTNVGGIETPNLEAFIDAVNVATKKGDEDDIFVRVRTESIGRNVKVVSIRTNSHYFGMAKLVLDEEVQHQQQEQQMSGGVRWKLV